MAVLAFVALHGLSLVVAKGVLLIAVCGLLISVAACCGAPAPGLTGLSSCSMWLYGAGSGVEVHGLVRPSHVGSSPSHRAHLCPCIGRLIPILVLPEKFSLYSLLNSQLFSYFFLFCILSYMRYSCTDACVFEIYLFCSIGLFFWALYIVDSFLIFCFIIDLTMN